MNAIMIQLLVFRINFFRCSNNLGNKQKEMHSEMD